MEIKKSPILEIRPNQVTEVRKLLNYSDVSRLKQDLDILEEWLKKQNHFVVKEFDRNYLERFLLNSKGSLERTKKRIDKLFTMRTLLPEMCLNLDIKHEFKGLFHASSQCLIPKPTEDKYRIVISQIVNDTNIDDVDMMSFLRYIIIIIEYLLVHDYSAGVEFIVDIRDKNLASFLKICNPIILQKGMNMLEAYGIRIKSMHWISSSKLLEKVLSIVKSVLSEKLRNRVHVHTSVETLYTHIPKELLPIDFGGQQKSVAELAANLRKELMSEENIQHIRRFETYKADESQRMSNEFNEEYSGMPGSFKTLCVD